MNLDSATGDFVNRVWYGGSSWYLALLPLSWLFAAATSLRRFLYRAGVLRTFDVGKPVIVVGNLAVGGTGKTPVAMWLAGWLKNHGLRPGIASRGYGGSAGKFPVPVVDDSDPRVVGDEPLLMARRAICPVVVHPDRVAAAAVLIEMGCNVIIADDGLQHHRLGRRFEIAVVDGARGFGNGRVLPAGPLREPAERLGTVDHVMLQGPDVTGAFGRWSTGVAHTCFELTATAVRDLRGRSEVSLEHFRGKTVHAVAAIGNPGRFFLMLESQGLKVIPHAFPDHASVPRSELEFRDGLDVLMTEKDAVKVGRPVPAHWWYVAVDLKLVEGNSGWLSGLLAEVNKTTRTQ
jgi:tetraacyldisaccharide 4'-kinase